MASNYQGRVPLTAKQANRALVRLTHSSRSVAGDTGILGVQGAAGSPWRVGGDSGTYEDVTSWTVGEHCTPVVIDGRRTRNQPHELHVSGFVHAAGTTLQVRLTQDGQPIERAQVDITQTPDSTTGERPPTIVVPVRPLREGIITLRYEVRILGGGGGRIAYVQVVASQEPISE